MIQLSHNWLFIILKKKKAGSRGRNCWRRLFKWFLKVWGHSWQASSTWAYANVFVQTGKKQPSFPAQAAAQTHSGTVLPLLLLSPGRTSISFFSVRTQHPPTCNHSQRTHPRMKPVLRRDQGQGMEKQPMAAFVSRTQLRQRPSWLAYLHPPRECKSFQGFFPDVYSCRNKCIFSLLSPQLGAEDTHVNKIPTRVHKTEGERDTATNICTDDNMVNTFQTPGLWSEQGREDAEQLMGEREGSASKGQFKWIWNAKILPDGGWAILGVKACRPWAAGSDVPGPGTPGQGPGGKSVILCAWKHWSKPTKLTLVLWEPGMCCWGESSLSFFNHRRSEAKNRNHGYSLSLILNDHVFETGVWF